MEACSLSRRLVFGLRSFCRVADQRSRRPFALGLLPRRPGLARVAPPALAAQLSAHAPARNSVRSSRLHQNASLPLKSRSRAGCAASMGICPPIARRVAGRAESAAEVSPGGQSTSGATLGGGSRRSCWPAVALGAFSLDVNS